MSLAKSSAVLQSVTATAVALFACSCVNEEYDFSNGIDGTVDIQGSISLPVGSTEFMPIGDFLELDQSDQSSILTTDAEGNYLLSIESEEPIGPEAPIEISQIAINAENLLPDNGGFVYPGIALKSRLENLPSDLQPMVPDENAEITEGVRDWLNGQIDEMPPFETSSTPIEINEDISEITDIVKDIKDIRLSAPVALVISIKGENGETLDNGKVTLKSTEEGKPFTIAFPDFVRLEPESDNVNISSDGHTLVFGEGTDGHVVDVTDPESTIFRFSIAGLDLTQLKENQGLDLENGTLSIDDEIVISDIRMGLDIWDFAETVGDIPEDIDIDINLNVEDVLVQSVSAVIDPQLGIDPVDLEIGELPDVISGNDITLDLYNPVICLDVLATDNSEIPGNFPVFNLSATLGAYDEYDSPTMDSPIVLGGEGTPVEINKGRNYIYLSRRDIEHNDIAQLDEYYEYLVIPELNDIIKDVPAYIRISDISVSVPHEGSEGSWAPGDYQTITFPETYNGEKSSLVYNVEVNYSMNVPLSFGEDLKLSYSTSFDGWNSNFSSTSDSEYTLELKTASIKFDFINTIPLELTLSAEPIDVNGEVMSETDIKVSLEGTLAAGNIDYPTSTAITVSVEATQEALDSFDGLKLNLEATSGDVIGVPLNENQGVRLENISATVEGGIQMDLNFQNQ